MRKNIKFHTAAENLEISPGLNQIRSIINEAAYITQVLHANLATLANICHCGAIDRNEDIIVLFVANNSAFYKINQLIPTIEDIFYAHQIRYNKIMIKVRPENSQATKHKKPNVLSQKQKDGLLRLAKQIGREDLIKAEISEITTGTESVDDFEIKL